MGKKVQKPSNTGRSEERLVRKAKRELLGLFCKSQLFTSEGFVPDEFGEFERYALSYLMETGMRKRREVAKIKPRIDGFLEEFKRWKRKYRNLVILVKARG